MSLSVEMTGREDLQDPWKIAIAGYPGAGKTLLSSTATKPLFVFFEENPRLKSVAHRHIPHVKLLNSSDAKVTVQDQLQALAMNLMLTDHEYETLVIDTGDELFQKIKQARRIKNGGEWGPGDWGWLGDTYREVVSGLIDLPMHVIVTFHLKSSEDDDGRSRELALQGAAKDEAPGWFDVVGVIDAFETADEQGDSVTKRVLLTHQSRTYSWVKDHSGTLPVRWPISENFVGDVPRLIKTLSTSAEGFKDGQEHQVIGIIEVDTPEPTVTGADVPTPEELQAKKQGVDADTVTAEPISPEPEPASTEGEGQEAEAEEEHPTESIPAQPEPAPDPISVEGPEVEGEDGESQEEPSAEEALANMEQELGAEEVHPCVVCGDNVEDEDLRELTQIRFRAIYCRPHFKEQLAAARA